MASRNMIFRMGVDASDFKTKMEQAGVTAERTGKRIKDSFSGAVLSDEVSRIMGWGSSSTGVRAITADNVALAQDQLQSLRSYKDMLAGAGFDDYQFGEVSERIRELEYDLNTYTESLRDAAAAESDAAGNAEDLGQAASRTSRSFRDMGSSGNLMERVSDQIGRIRSSADRSDLSVGKLLRSIRNISIADFGFRLVRSVFGELRSITSGYISQNETLQAQVDGLNASMGQALAPAINVATNAMSYLMPYVVGVSNAFGELMANLFGSGWSTAAADAQKTSSAIGNAASAQKEMNRQLFSFDQINKMNSAGGTAAGGGGSGTSATPIEGKTPAWAERFKSAFSELFESDEFQNANIGGKIGQILQTGLDWLGDEGTAFDWSGVGSKLRSELDSTLSVDLLSSLSRVLGVFTGGFAEMVVSFLGPQWEELRIAYQNEGWQGAAAYILGMGAALASRGISSLFTSVLSPFFSGIGEAFRKSGHESIAGYFEGIAEKMIGAGEWIKENITDPIINYTKNLLGIHSPSTVFASIGMNCMMGAAGGFSAGMELVQEKLDSLKERVIGVSESLRNAFDFNWRMPTLRLPHLNVEWDPVDNVLAEFFGVTAFPRLSVSWFAKGFVTNGTSILGQMGSSLIGVGERGREALLPLDSNTSWMDDLADRLSARLDTQCSGDVNATINVVVDGDILTTKVIRGLRKRSRSGAPVF